MPAELSPLRADGLYTSPMPPRQLAAFTTQLKPSPPLQRRFSTSPKSYESKNEAALLCIARVCSSCCQQARWCRIAPDWLTGGNHQQPVAARPPGRLVQECSTQQVTGRPALVGDATSRLELFLVGTQSCLPLVGDTLALIDSIRPIAEHIF